MPLPTALFLAFATGALAALVGRHEVKLSPRHALLTRAHAAYVIYATFVLVPAAAYFYTFHGDWFALYLFDTSSIPSAVALVAFGGMVGIGVMGFAAASSLVRASRESFAMGLTGAAIFFAIIVPLVLRDRLDSVGTIEQFRGGFGLAPIATTALLPGIVVMDAIALAGFGLLVQRLFLGLRGSS